MELVFSRDITVRYCTVLFLHFWGLKLGKISEMGLASGGWGFAKSDLFCRRRLRFKESSNCLRATDYNLHTVI